MARILLIDDDDGLRRVLRRALQRRGYEVLEAPDGREGLSLVGREQVDLVLTDMIMPGMEGVETIQQLRRTHPGLPIIAMSGGGRLKPEGYLQLAETFGALSVLRKPFENDQLFATIEAVLNTKLGPHT
ncbi:MAG: response regulator [Acidobacteriota bacterium]